MIIEYETSKYVKETKKIEIKDTKNVFLKGKNVFDGLDTYFGIWINNKSISIVTIISYRTITYKHFLTEHFSTLYDIQEYLKHNDNVIVIEKKEFEKQINHLKSIFKI